MYKIIAVSPEPDFKLHLEFNDGSRVIYNMQKLVKTIPYIRLNEWVYFKKVRYDDKSVYWEPEESKPEYLPLRLSIDTILFSLRD